MTEATVAPPPALAPTAAPTPTPLLTLQTARQLVESICGAKSTLVWEHGPVGSRCAVLDAAPFLFASPAEAKTQADAREVAVLKATVAAKEAWVKVSQRKTQRAEIEAAVQRCERVNASGLPFEIGAQLVQRLVSEKRVKDGQVDEALHEAQLREVQLQQLKLQHHETQIRQLQAKIAAVDRLKRAQAPGCPGVTVLGDPTPRRFFCDTFQGLSQWYCTCLLERGWLPYPAEEWFTTEKTNLKVYAPLARATVDYCHTSSFSRAHSIFWEGGDWLEDKDKLAVLLQDTRGIMPPQYTIDERGEWSALLCFGEEQQERDQPCPSDPCPSGEAIPATEPASGSADPAPADPQDFKHDPSSDESKRGPSLDETAPPPGAAVITTTGSGSAAGGSAGAGGGGRGAPDGPRADRTSCCDDESGGKDREGSFAGLLRLCARAGGEGAQTLAHQRWFVKDATRNYGLGNTVCSNLGACRGAVRPGERFVAQLAVTPQLLLNGCVFSVRLYLLVVAINRECPSEVQCFTADQGWLSMAPQPFVQTSLDPKSNMSHDRAARLEYWPGWRPAYHKCRHIVRQVLLLARDKLVVKAVPSFELFGVDFVMDGSGKPWLVEINRSPRQKREDMPLMHKLLDVALQEHATPPEQDCPWQWEPLPLG